MKKTVSVTEKYNYKLLEAKTWTLNFVYFMQNNSKVVKTWWNSKTVKCTTVFKYDYLTWLNYILL